LGDTLNVPDIVGFMRGVRYCREWMWTFTGRSFATHRFGVSRRASMGERHLRHCISRPRAWLYEGTPMWGSINHWTMGIISRRSLPAVTKDRRQEGRDAQGTKRREMEFDTVCYARLGTERQIGQICLQPFNSQYHEGPNIRAGRPLTSTPPHFRGAIHRPSTPPALSIFPIQSARTCRRARRDHHLIHPSHISSP
jgi:hypothetical protein